LEEWHVDRTRVLAVVAVVAVVISGAAVMVDATRDITPPNREVVPVSCPKTTSHPAPKWSASSLKVPPPGPGGLALSRDDLATAVRVFAASPFIRRMYARAGKAPQVQRVQRINLSAAEATNHATPHAKMATVVAAPVDVCIPGPHPSVLFDTEHVHTSEPRGYTVWTDPGAWLHPLGVVAYVDLLTHRVAGVEAPSHSVETFPKGFHAPKALIDRAKDASD
jgi:hypothetical protein